MTMGSSVYHSQLSKGGSETLHHHSLREFAKPLKTVICNIHGVKCLWLPHPTWLYERGSWAFAQTDMARWPQRTMKIYCHGNL